MPISSPSRKAGFLNRPPLARQPLTVSLARETRRIVLPRFPSFHGPQNHARLASRTTSASLPQEGRAAHVRLRTLQYRHVLSRFRGFSRTTSDRRPTPAPRWAGSEDSGSRSQGLPKAAPQAALFTDVSDSHIPSDSTAFSPRPTESLPPSGLEPRRDCRSNRGNGRPAKKGSPGSNVLAESAPSPLRKHQPKTLRTGPSQQIVHLGRDVNWAGCPHRPFHADEEYPAFTAGRLITRGPDGGHLHVGRHDFRITRLPATRGLLASLQPAGPTPGHYRRRGEAMPVAIAFGGEPCRSAHGHGPLPRRIDVLELAGYLRGAPCEMVPGRRVDLPVPADAELIIEGTIAPDEPTRDGRDRPGRHGTATSAAARPRRPCRSRHPSPHALVPVPVARARKAAIHRTLVEGVSALSPPELPGPVRLEFPAFGGDRLWAFASIDKTYAGQGGQFANAFWGLPKMLPVRYLVLVDEDVDVGNTDEVWACRLCPRRTEQRCSHRGRHPLTSSSTTSPQAAWSSTPLAL